MKAIASILAGVCVFEDDPQRRIVDLKSMSSVTPERAHLTFGAIDDWNEFNGVSRDALLQDLKQRHQVARAVSNIELCLLGISYELQQCLLVDVEDLLLEGTSDKKIIESLLRAPFEDSANLVSLVTVCLARGLASTAAMVEEVRESQPLLKRFAERWLALPDAYFQEISGGRQRIWRMSVDAGVVRDTLNAKDARSVEHAWAQLAFSMMSPGERVKLAAIAKAIAEASHPTHRDLRQSPQLEKSEQDVVADTDKPLQEESHQNYQRVMKQVSAIVAAVAQGQDTKARQYMVQLFDEQMSVDGGEANAVRSLCNIAIQCADMFRTDFELECLELALNANSQDAWTLVQLADHYKRVGRFGDAIATLAKALTLGESRVVHSSLADVYVQMGNFDRALDVYDAIPNGKLDVVTRVSKADVLRIAGRYDLAKAEYDQIEFDGHSSNRVQAGLAEIAKRTGNLAVARRVYEVLVARETDEKSLVIYRMALANVLVRSGDLLNAYKLVDAVVTTCPFLLQARAFRAAIQGLLGNPFKALQDVPQLPGVESFNAWVTGYVRGLLLLLLNRYDDGRKALLRNVETSFRDRTGEGMLRLGAAVCFLRANDDVDSAAKILEDSTEVADTFADSIRTTLQYHVALVRKESDDIKRLKGLLASVADSDLLDLISSLEAKDWVAAWNLEVRALLRLQLAA